MRVMGGLKRIDHVFLGVSSQRICFVAFIFKATGCPSLLITPNVGDFMIGRVQLGGKQATNIS